MRVLDLEQLDDASPIEADLCIVGGGPAGLAIANEFIGMNISVLVLESGGLKDEFDTHALAEIESVGATRVLNQDFLRRRILGGSSHVWTGRCAPFDALDFENRPWVQHSGWPLTRADLDPYLERAGPYLGLGPNCYDETLWRHFKVDRPVPPLDTQFLEPKFWQFSTSPDNQKVPVHFGRDLIRSNAQNIQVLLHANLIHINTSAGGTRFESADVSTLHGKRILVRAKAMVLCCGGIENARVLLASNRSIPRGIGNQNDLVGRFLMDHTDCAIWAFEPRHARAVLSRFGGYWLDNKQRRHVYLHGLALSREAQQEYHLLNCHAYVDQFDAADDDPWSALNRVVPALRSATITKEIFRDARIVLTHSGEICRGLYRRRFKHRPQLVRANRTELHFILEQMPDPESRITLSEKKTDALGMPLSRINWRISDTERQTAKRMSQLIAQEFERLRLPVPLIPTWLDEKDGWILRCVEKAHPAGTTRMSCSSKEGVVDANCQVHDVAGLFISGSSVFPTSGAANPTLMIVAMSLRLADWLKAHYFRPLRSPCERAYMPREQHGSST